MFIARISVIVEGRRHIAGQLPVCVVRGFVAVDGASRIFAGIPVRMLVVLPRGGVKSCSVTTNLTVAVASTLDPPYLEYSGVPLNFIVAT